MTQPAAGSAGTPKRRIGLPGRQMGNPQKIKRGETVRAVLAATLRPNEPMPLEMACQIVQVSRTTLLAHLATMQTLGRIRGYTTARGVVRVW